MHDIITECNNQNIDGLTLLVDFQKAFDSISWKWYQSVKATEEIDVTNVHLYGLILNSTLTLMETCLLITYDMLQTCITIEKKGR